MAPEIIECTAFNKMFQLDWWAFGVLLYELRFKKSPFKADTIDELQNKILREDIVFPKMNEPENEQKCFKKLVRKLLIKDPTERLGYSVDGSGAADIKKQKFFKKYIFEDVYKQNYDSPYDPKVNTAEISKLKKNKGFLPWVLINSEVKMDL